MKHILRKAVNTIGYDIVRYQAEQSRFYRIQRLLISHEIDLVLDVGANVGQYARFIRQTGYSGRIVSFEPLSSAYRQLQKNKDSDSLWSIAPQAAIGDVEGKIKLNIAKNSFSSSVLDMLDAHIEAAPASSYIGSEIVSMNRLDSIAGPFITEGIRNVFLKIDAQGFEKQVLRGPKGSCQESWEYRSSYRLWPYTRGRLS